LRKVKVLDTLRRVTKSSKKQRDLKETGNKQFSRDSDRTPPEVLTPEKAQNAGNGKEGAKKGWGGSNLGHAGEGLKGKTTKKVGGRRDGENETLNSK